ncbi:carbon storage regulator [Sinomonas sp. RB5]
MLVLTRKPGQKIMVGADIVITVLEDKGEDGIRIGIEAPRHVSIKREEIHTAVSEANMAATGARAEDLLNGLGLQDPALRP